MAIRAGVDEDVMGEVEGDLGDSRGMGKHVKGMSKRKYPQADLMAFTDLNINCPVEFGRA